MVKFFLTDENRVEVINLVDKAVKKPSNEFEEVLKDICNQFLIKGYLSDKQEELVSRYYHIKLMKYPTPTKASTKREESLKRKVDELKNDIKHLNEVIDVNKRHSNVWRERAIEWRYGHKFDLNSLVKDKE